MSEDLLSIGHVARLSGLTPKALRLYDESGLLVPDRVDPFTGYRSYRPGQLARARLIAALRGVGMDLARIAVVCDQDPAGASQEVLSWWHQQRADAASRDGLVRELLAAFDETPKENIMSTTHLTARGSSRARRIDRPTLQDVALSQGLPGGRLLLAVADGFGEEAPSNDVVQAFSAHLTTALEREANALDAVRSAWDAASAAVPDAGGGSTLTAALVDGEDLVLAHIGDTRAMLVRGGALLPLTQDHTFTASLVAAGRLEGHEVASHPQRATLNRALAPGAPREPDVVLRTLQSGDRLVLVSDGVHAVLETRRFAQIVTAQGAPEGICAALEEAVLSAGGGDDLAIAVADIG